MDSTNRKAIEQYYDLLEETLQQNDLMNFPAQIYNMDKSGMLLDPRPPNVVAQRRFVTEYQERRNKSLS